MFGHSYHIRGFWPCDPTFLQMNLFYSLFYLLRKLLHLVINLCKGQLRIHQLIWKHLRLDIWNNLRLSSLFRREHRIYPGRDFLWGHRIRKSSNQRQVFELLMVQDPLLQSLFPNGQNSPSSFVHISDWQTSLVLLFFRKKKFPRRRLILSLFLMNGSILSHQKLSALIFF